MLSAKVLLTYLFFTWRKHDVTVTQNVSNYLENKMLQDDK